MKVGRDCDRDKMKGSSAPRSAIGHMPWMHYTIFRGRNMNRSSKTAVASAIFALVLCSYALAVIDAEQDLWFPVGEELVYRLYWGFFPVGKTRVTSEWVEEEGRRLIAIRYRTRTNRFVEKLYPVNDYIEALIDPVSFRPVRFAKKLRRRKLLCDEETTFDYEKLIATWTSKCSGEERLIHITPEVRELVSFMYFMRKQAFEPGEIQTHRILADGKLWDAKVIVHEKEDVKTPVYGRVPCVKLEPKADFHGVFDLKGTIFLWVSEDNRRVCTRMTGDVPVGTVKAVLCEVHGPGDDNWVRISRGLKKHPCPKEPSVENEIRELVPDVSIEDPRSATSATETVESL